MQLSFFERIEKIVAPRRRAFRGSWNLTDHSCRHCMGRVMEGSRPDGSPMVRCSECGAEADGGHDALCWCGVEMPNHGRVFECFRNPEVTPGAPQEILVREKPKVRG